MLLFNLKKTLSFNATNYNENGHLALHLHHVDWSKRSLSKNNQTAHELNVCAILC